MDLTKEQKKMIKDSLELKYSLDSHPKALQTLIDERAYLPLLEKVSSLMGYYLETFERDFLAEIEEWESRQLDGVKVKRRSGLIVGSTVGEERTKKAREARKKIVDRLERRKEKVKTKEMIF